MPQGFDTMNLRARGHNDQTGGGLNPDCRRRGVHTGGSARTRAGQPGLEVRRPRCGRLRSTLGPSAMTLGGILKHLALGEEYWFGERFLGRPLGPPWGDVDWDTAPDWERRTAAEDSPEQLYAIWSDAVQTSRNVVAEALAQGGLDQSAAFVTSEGESPSLRRLLIDMIAEYARHVGHSDLIRESIDGRAGEDPPD